jgi:hypothetical protein
MLRHQRSLVARLAIAPAFLLVAACSSSPDDDDPPAGANESSSGAPAGGAKEEAAAKVADLSNQAAMARRKIDRAAMDLEQQKGDGDAALAKANAELDLAKKALAHFDAVEAPQRLAKAELDLKDASDAATEQQEEMQQLEMMYAKDDLGDKTKEIVLARGKRRLERVKQRLALATKDIEDLKAVQLPEQRTRLALAVTDKEQEVKRAEFAAKSGLMDKETAVIAAQQELEKNARELEKAQKAQ